MPKANYTECHDADPAWDQQWAGSDTRGDPSALRSRSRPAAFGQAVLAPFRALISHRQAIQIFVNRDIRGRYINSALGLWWAVIQPLALLALYTFVFSRIMSIRLNESAEYR